MKKIMLLAAIGLLFCSCASQPKPWTKAEKTFAIASVLAQAADSYTTIKALENKNNHEMNGVLGRRPSNAKVISVGISSELITLILSHYINIDNFRLWFLGTKTAVSTGLAIHSRSLDRN